MAPAEPNKPHPQVIGSVDQGSPASRATGDVHVHLLFLSIGRIFGKLPIVLNPHRAASATPDLEIALLAEQLPKQWRERVATVPIDTALTFRTEGLVLGAGTVLAPPKSLGACASISSEKRLITLLSAAYRRPVGCAAVALSAARPSEGARERRRSPQRIWLWPGSAV